MKQNLDLGRSLAPTAAEPGSGVDTLLYKRRIDIERKHVTIDFKENSRGRFLRITEEVNGHRNAIVVPLGGVEDFRDALNEIINFSKTLSPTH